MRSLSTASLALLVGCFPSDAAETWAPMTTGASSTSSTSGDGTTTGATTTTTGEGTTTTTGASTSTTTTGAATSDTDASSTSAADTDTDTDTDAATSDTGTTTGVCVPMTAAIAPVQDAFFVDGGNIGCSINYGEMCSILNAGAALSHFVGQPLTIRAHFAVAFPLEEALAELGYGLGDVTGIRLALHVRGDLQEVTPAATLDIQRIDADNAWYEGDKAFKLAVTGDSSYLHRQIDGDVQVLWSGGQGPAGAATKIAELAIQSGLYKTPTEVVSEPLEAGLVAWLSDPETNQGLLITSPASGAYTVYARESEHSPALLVDLCR